MIKIIFSRSVIRTNFDNELEMFLKTLKVGSKNKTDIRIMVNYFNLDWPDGQSFLGYEVSQKSLLHLIH